MYIIFISYFHFYTTTKSVLVLIFIITKYACNNVFNKVSANPFISTGDPKVHSCMNVTIIVQPLENVYYN